MTDSTHSFGSQVDTIHHQLTLLESGGQHYDLSYAEQGNGTVILSGLWKKDPIKVRMRRVDLNGFRLLNRGFHMINEVPYNR